MESNQPILATQGREFSYPEVAETDPASNTTDILLERVNAHPDAPLYAVQDSDGQWSDISGATFLAQVMALAKGLIASGFAPGDRIGLMSRVRCEWPLIDFAIWFAGLVTVPIYETSSASQIAWNMRDSGAKALFVENASMLEQATAAQRGCPELATLWTIDNGDVERLAMLGRSVSDDTLETRRSAADLNSLATIIYTSGTTGNPRGCMVTHGNFSVTARNGATAMSDVLGSGSTLMFATMAHVLARFVVIACIFGGTKVGFQPDTSKLVPTMKTFKPGFLLAVPRVFEKVYNASVQSADEQRKGRIVRRAANVAVSYSKGIDRGRIPLKIKIFHKIYDVLVYRKVRDAMGGKVKYAISGSAPLGSFLGHFYRGIGIKVLEGYGLTESTAPATVNTSKRAKIGTVGYPFPGTSIRADDEGHIEIKGPHVFAGYWREPEATAKVFTEDGWLKTGDLGMLDEDGYLTITGREKDIIVTAGGKNVAPAMLEDPIRANPLVAQVIVAGDKRPFVSALITLDYEMMPAWLETHGQDRNMDHAAMIENEVVVNEIRRAIIRANKKVSRAESIRKFVIMDEEFHEGTKYLTPSLKIKRHVVLDDFADVLDRLYAEPEFGHNVTQEDGDAK